MDANPATFQFLKAAIASYGRARDICWASAYERVRLGILDPEPDLRALTQHLRGTQTVG